MFIDFFFNLKKIGIPVTLTSFLKLHKSLSLNLISNIDDFYIVSRCILIKSEKYFDHFDQVFFNYFYETLIPNVKISKLKTSIKKTLKKWLKENDVTFKLTEQNKPWLNKIEHENLMNYFKKQLKKQTKRHDGGNQWIGTRGTSPLGHSGYHPGGMRISGISKNKSAIKVIMEKKFKIYNTEEYSTKNTFKEVLKKLKDLKPIGYENQIDIPKTISNTTKNGGEIDIFFKRKLKNKIKISLFIDNGGWSMNPYTSVIQELFYQSKSQFKYINIYYFHNTIYETIWKDPKRYNYPIKLNEVAEKEKNSDLIIIGDASMAPQEIKSNNGSINEINIKSNNKKSSLQCLNFLSDVFHRSVWLNPINIKNWKYVETIKIIRQIFPMFELSIKGIEKAIFFLNKKR